MSIEPYVPQIRRLRLRGGPADGSTWEGEIGVGQRIAGPGPWSPEGVYVVTAETIPSADGGTENVAEPVPLEAGPPDGGGERHGAVAPGATVAAAPTETSRAADPAG
jgi:hypothetical protein